MNILEESNDFLNASIDTLEFSPDFVVPPTGNYAVTVHKCELGSRDRSVKGSPTGETEEVMTVELQLKVDQVLDESVSPDGIVGNVIGYTFWDKAGITNGFVKVFRELMVSQGLTTIGELIDFLANARQLEIVHKATKASKKSNNPDAVYANLQAVALI